MTRKTCPPPYAPPSRDQQSIRRSVAVGNSFQEVSPASFWARCSVMDNPQMVLGALELAYQQHADGMGTTAEQWMGLTAAEFARWRSGGAVRLALAVELMTRRA